VARSPPTIPPPNSEIHPIQLLISSRSLLWSFAGPKVPLWIYHQSEGKQMGEDLIPPWDKTPPGAREDS
jgi:hypothetical protein